MLKSDPFKLPGHNAVNALMGLGNVAAMGAYLQSADPTFQLAMLGATTGLSSALGVTLTAAIGGLSDIFVKNLYEIVIPQSLEQYLDTQSSFLIESGQWSSLWTIG